MKDILIYSLIIASLSFIISETLIFKTIRIKIKFRSRFFGKLVGCGYCLAHWWAVIIMIVFQPELFPIWTPLDYFFIWLIISWIAGAQWILMCVLFKIAGK